MNPYCISFFGEFENEYEALKSSFSDIITKATQMLTYLQRKIKELHKWLKDYVFETKDEEMYFFKELKPKLFSKLIYYKTILKIETNSPASKRQKRKFYEKALDKVYHYNKRNKEFYEYYRSRASFNDEQYFIRNGENLRPQEDCYLMNYDERVCTSHDYKVAIIMSNDLINTYLENKIEEIDKNCQIKHPALTSHFNWTSSKFDLIELIYALHNQKVINYGNVDVKEVAQQICKTFNVEYDDKIYRYYHDIKRRKTNKTRFMQSLSDNFNQKLSQEN